MPPGKDNKSHDKPHEKPHHKPHEKPHESAIENSRALNTAENAIAAVATARAVLPELVAGTSWTHRAPHGEELKGSLLRNDVDVLVLHFSPEDGSVLPKGLRGLSKASDAIIALVEGRLGEVALQLTVLDGAEFREPEFCWAVPVAHQGRIVGHLKVAADGQSVIAAGKNHGRV